MSSPADEPGKFDLPELWRLLEDLESGGIDPSASDALANLLTESPAARRAYIEYFQQTSVLRMEASKLHERGLLPVVGSVEQTRRVVRRSVLAAAALVALAAAVAALIVSRPEPAGLMAMVAADTRWSIDGIAQQAAADPVRVGEGSTVDVLSGTVHLKLESGDQLLLQGPAHVSFPSIRRPVLQKGWLWIDAPGPDESFEVATAGLTIRDIGTRFGIRAVEAGPAEVHLLDGRVVVLSGDSGKLLADLDKAGQARAFTRDGKIEALPLAPDPFPALQKLLSRPANYRTTVLAQAPVGYWPLDDATASSLANEVAGSSAGFQGLAVRGGDPGPGPHDGFDGFPEAHGAMFLTGMPDRSALAGIDGIHGVRQSEGAVSFWIRRPAGQPPREEALWLAGTNDGQSKAPSQSILNSRITAEGRLVFEIENGKTDVYLSSPRSVADGRWHHVAASWGPASVELYLDGRLVGRDVEPRVLDDGYLRGRFVRFGKPSNDQQGVIHGFTGWVDEIALWDRPLAPFEVACQIEAAKGRKAK